VRDDQLRPGVRLDESVEVVGDRRQPASAVDQDRDSPFGRELEDRREPLVVQEKPLRARMELDPARPGIETPTGLFDRLLAKVEPNERDQAALRAPRVLEAPVVRGAERRVPVRLVQAEHETALDAVAVRDALEIPVDADHPVDVVPQVHVRVEDLCSFG
jgi:hypothetical protein